MLGGAKRGLGRSARILIPLTLILWSLYELTRHRPIHWRGAYVSKTQHLANTSSFCQNPLVGFATERDDILCQLSIADEAYDRLVSSQSKTVEEGVTKYKRKYRRDPPKGFAEWVEYALRVDSKIIDSFDGLESDLKPFRHMPKETVNTRIRNALAAGHSEFLQIEGGKAYGVGVSLIVDLLQPIVKTLPDLLLPFNGLSEPRVINSFSHAQGPDQVQFHQMQENPYVWDLMRKPCHSPLFLRMLDEQRRDSVKGWIYEQSNICQHGELRNMHGFLQLPPFFIMTDTLFPVASRSKLAVFGDIRVPAMMDAFSEQEGSDVVPFSQKANKFFWRGPSSGFSAPIFSWKTGHRQRFNLLLNNLAEAAQENVLIKPWLVDVGITAYENCVKEVCTVQDALMGRKPDVSTAETLKHRFVFDLDGNGASDRFLTLLRSNSLVFKQTIFQEWHDDRLIPWKHYVPVSMSMDGIEKLIDFFSSDEGALIAEQIAKAGSEWAAKVLRVEDARLYWARLVISLAELQ